MPGRPLLRRERLNHGEILIHQDAQDQWLVTWVPDEDNAMDYPGFTITPASADFPALFGSAHDPDALISWARKQPWAMRHFGRWTEPVQVDARSPLLIESDALNLTLLGIILTLGLSLALALGAWVGTACGIVWGFVTGLSLFVAVSAVLIALVPWPPTNRRVTGWARNLTPPPT
jgi:hypothetical protein